jgi:hypothetical protein
MRRGLGRGLQRGRRHGSGGTPTPTPTPTPTAAVLAYDGASEQFVVTNSASFPGAVWEWKDEDGNVIAGQVADTMPESAQPDGKYVQAIPDGDLAAASNFAISPIDLPAQVFDFLDPNGTSLDGYAGWKCYSPVWSGSIVPQASTAFQTIDGYLVQTDAAGSDGDFTWRRTDAPLGNKRLDLYNYVDPTGINNFAKAERRFYLNLSADHKYYIHVTPTNNGYRVVKKVNGATTTLISQAGAGTGIDLTTTFVSFILTDGRLHVLVNDVELPVSASAGGWDVSDVPATNNFAFAGTGTPTSGQFPYKYADKFSLTALASIQFALTSSSFGADTITASGTCTSSVTNYDWALVDATGKVWKQWTSNVPVDSAGVWSINASMPEALQGTRVYVAMRPSTNKANLILADAGVPPVLPTFGDAVLGINAPFINQWNTSDPFSDLGTRLEWRGPDWNYIVPPSKVPALGGSQPDIPMSADGEGGTVKADMDGTIYPYNTVGFTQYMLIPPSSYSEAGDYVIKLAPGLVITDKVVPSISWFYDTGSGDLTYTVPAGGKVTSFAVLITTASMPASGLKPTIGKVGETIYPCPPARGPRCINGADRLRRPQHVCGRCQQVGQQHGWPD